MYIVDKFNIATSNYNSLRGNNGMDCDGQLI